MLMLRFGVAQLRSGLGVRVITAWADEMTA